ncbi:MAG: efflux RND transporter permease subunit, partial [Holophagales bacterium]|nr:efflux RND transporter permease subunit [Holophagales bacterium]
MADPATSTASHRRPRAVLALSMALLAGGSWVALQLPVEWVPTLRLPGVVVTTSWPGAPPLAVEKRVTAPIERALRSVSGSAHVHSRSSEGSSVVRVELSPETDLHRYSTEASGEIALLRRQLPPQATPRLEQQAPEALESRRGFMVLKLAGHIEAHELRRAAERQVTPELRSLGGVAGISVEGGEQEEILVTLDDARLRAGDLTTEQVERALRDAMSRRPFGWIEDGGRRLLLVRSADADLESLRDLALVIDPRSGASIRLRDVADLSRGDAPRASISRIDGKPVVSLDLELAPEGHLLRTAAAVHSRLDAIRNRLPDGVELSVAVDRAGDLRENLRDLAVRGGAGLLGLFLVLAVLLRGLRPALAVCFAVALSVAVALALLRPLGLSLNLLTLAGLVLIVGLLVDNAVVVVEQRVACRRRHPSWSEAERLRRVLGNVRTPLVGGTLSTAVVLGPFVYSSGELRALFGPFALLVVLTLLFSLAVALLVVPVLPMPRVMPARRSAWLRAAGHPAAPYSLAARFPRTTLLLLVALIGLPTPWLPDWIPEPDLGWESAEARRIAERFNATLGHERLQPWRQILDPLLGGVMRPFLERVRLGDSWGLDPRPQLSVRLALPPGSGIERADEMISAFERRALASPATERTLLRVLPDFAFLSVRLVPGAEHTEAPFLLRESLILEGADVAGLDLAVWGLVPMGFFSGRGRVSGFTVEAFGPGLEGLQELASELRERLIRRPRFVDVDPAAGPEFGASLEARDVLRLRWNAPATARTGATARGLAADLRAQVDSRAPAFFTALGDGQRLGVRLTTATARASDLHELLARPQGDKTFRLSDLAEVVSRRQPAVIERQDQVYKQYLRVYFRGPHKMGRELLTEELQAMTPPHGYRLELEDPRFLTAGVRTELVAVLAAALALIFLILAAVFESWKLPCLVLLSVPTAFVGVAVGFLWSGAALAEGAFIGAVLLTGIAVNDSILL